jgi:hypothetical protein
MEALMEIEGPKKTKTLLWLALKNRVLTWDMQGTMLVLNICMLCRNDCETNVHLFVHFPYSQSREKKSKNLTGVDNVWLDNTIEECLRAWFQKKEPSNFRAITCLVLWGIWLAWNSTIFEDEFIPYFQVYGQIYALGQKCITQDVEKIPRQIQEVQIDRSFCWSFFDGAFQSC